MIRNFIFPLLWAMTILCLSSVPSKELPDFSFWNIFGIDKLVHIAMYGILSFLVLKSGNLQPAHWKLQNNIVFIAALSGVVYGGLIELYQEFILFDRHGEWMDFVANMAGTFFGIMLFKKFAVKVV